MEHKEIIKNVMSANGGIAKLYLHVLKKAKDRMIIRIRGIFVTQNAKKQKNERKNVIMRITLLTISPIKTGNVSMSKKVAHFL